MSRDMIFVGPKDSTGTARRLLLAHNIRTLPVVDVGGRLLGTVGLRDLVSDVGPVADAMTPALTAAPSESAFNLIEALTDGQSHAVVITGDDGRTLGLLTQTDLLAAISRLPILYAGSD
jgi:CBS domain-containing membrane protein